MDVPHGLGAQPLGLVPGLQPACPSLLQQLLVELLQFQRSEFFQGDLANVGFDVVVDVAPVGLVGGWPYFLSWRSAQTTPPSTAPPCTGQPWPCPVLSLPRLLVSAWPWPLPGFFPGRSCRWPCPSPGRGRRCTGLPATVLALAEVSLPVGSTFCHGLLPPLQQHNITAEREKYPGPWRRVIKTFIFVGYPAKFGPRSISLFKRQSILS